MNECNCVCCFRPHLQADPGLTPVLSGNHPIQTSQPQPISLPRLALLFPVHISSSWPTPPPQPPGAHYCDTPLGLSLANKATARLHVLQSVGTKQWALRSAVPTPITAHTRG